MTDHQDLYQQMLWDARKMEDIRLIRMLQKRMHLGDAAEPAKPSGDIVPFPVSAAPSLGGEQSIFWKECAFWQSLLQTLMVMGIVGTWFFMPFIKIILDH